MKKRLLSLPQYVNDIEKLPIQPDKLMQQHKKTDYALLAQNINHIIANSTNPCLMLQEIAHLIGAAFKADCCCLVTVPSDSSSEVTTANWCSEQYLELSPADQIISIEQLMISSQLVQCASEPLTVDDISIIQQNISHGCQSLPLPIKSVLAIPTRFGGKYNGVISLIKFQSYNWQESEKQLLRAVESSCAIALAQISQAHLLRTQKQNLHKTRQHQSLIKQLTTLSLSHLELNQMLQLVISSTAESLEADRGLLILLKYSDPIFRNLPKKQIPKAKAVLAGEWKKTNSISLDALDKLEQSFWLSDCGLCQRVFAASGKPIMFDNCNQENDDIKPNPLFAIEEFPTTLLMPLENQGKVLGFVVLQQEVARNWQPAELNLVEMVCVQLSNTIIQSQTLRQVQNLVDERTEQLKRSLEVQAKLYERTKQYVEQLQQLNELKDEFVSNISDRLRYPLTNMRMSIRNLRLPGIPPERQTRYLDILESECTKEINLINDLLTLQKLEAQDEAPQFETIDVNTKINEFATSIEKQLTEKELTISVDLPKEPLKLQTEIESFERILQELLTNASKYSERASIVRLQAMHRVEENVDQVIIKVTNTGRGISQEEAAYIFDKFRRGKGRWTPGTGLGLALVKSLVQHLHGAIAIDSTPITDSSLSEICFTLTLPQFSPPTQPYSQQ
jgi:signal transduction histidine kinase